MSQSQVIEVEELQQLLEVQQLQDLHVATCMLMTRFINGHHCPKLAHSIVYKLGQLLSFSQSISVQIATNQEMYLELLDHWKKVTHQLSEQQIAKQNTTVRHYHQKHIA